MKKQHLASSGKLFMILELWNKKVNIIIDCTTFPTYKTLGVTFDLNSEMSPRHPDFDLARKLERLATASNKEVSHKQTKTNSDINCYTETK